jgi:transcriptional regulator with XRE-family HTH domain
LSIIKKQIFSLLFFDLFDILKKEMTILDRIRLIRKKIGLKQGEFADRIGLTQTSMSMIEAGKSSLTDKNIKLICATFGVNEDWLRTGKGTMFGPASPYEKELLAVFDKLTADTQEFILEMAQNLLRRQKKNSVKYHPDHR